MSDTRRASLAGLLRDRRGAVVITVAVAMTALTAIAGVAIDGSHLYVVRTKLQSAADSAALAAAAELPSHAATKARGVDYAAKNMPAEANGVVLVPDDVSVGRWNGATRAFTALDEDAGAPNAVRVTTRRSASNGNPAPTFFARILGYRGVDVVAQAVAAKGEPTCMLALDSSASASLYLDSNASITSPDCGIHVNSTHNSALLMKSNSYVDVASVCITGDYRDESTGKISPTPETGCYPMADPFAGVAPPTVGSCDYNNTSLDNKTQTIYPGVYCGGLEIKGNSNITFAPGTYIIKGDEFFVDSNSRIQSSGVSFYLADKDAVIHFDSNSVVNLVAPSSGPLAGLLFYQNRTVSGMPVHRIDSNSNNKYLEGGVYLPAGKLLVDSNSAVGGGSPCMMLVARRFEFNSNAEIQVTADLNSCSVPLPAAMTGRIRLVR